jgi:hypothetical protein
MTLFLLSIWCIGREFIDDVDSIRLLSISIHWRFQGLHLLFCHQLFMDLQWHNILDNSMRQPWLYFYYRFDVSVVNSLMMSITYVGSKSLFIDNFKLYSDSVFAVNLWISSDIAFLTIPCVGLDSSFDIDLMRQLWIHWCCRFQAVAVTQYSLTISRSTVPLFWPGIYGSAVT